MGLSLPISLTRELDATLQEQIYRQVRDGILAGSLGPGLKLPSSRDICLKRHWMRAPKSRHHRPHPPRSGGHR